MTAMAKTPDVHAVGAMAVGSQWRETDHRAAQLPHA